MIAVAIVAMALFVNRQAISYERWHAGEQCDWGAEELLKLAEKTEQTSSSDPVLVAKAKKQADGLRKSAQQFRRMAVEYKEAASRPWQRFQDPLRSHKP
jgi:hypothetical protein